MGRYRRRLQPSMGEFKRMVGLVVSTEAKMSVIEILNAIRSRCPEWTVTPCRLRKALAALHAETNRGDAPQSGKCRIYPHDVVELRPGSRKQKLRRMWRGQVYRVSGYDDGASSDEELPPGRCSVSWIGDNLHQTPGLRMKESSLQLIDRPFVIGDRVSAVKDPQSLGLVVDVRPAFTLHKRVHVAAAAYRAGQFSVAEGLYTEALESAEDAESRTSALVSRAQCRLKLQRFEDAREDAAAARALAPENPKAWYRLGVANAHLARLEEAEEALKEALSLRPADKDVASALTSVRRRLLEAEGRYAWLEVYEQYFQTGTLAVAKAKQKQMSQEGGSGAEGEDFVIASLDVEPYVGPVRIGHSPERGRGLFLTEDVPQGRLLLCAQALVTGLNEDLPRLLQEAARSEEVGQVLRSLSRGTKESEEEMPLLSPAQLAAPRKLLRAEATSEVESSVEEMKAVLYYNQFGLPIVNPNAAPLEIGNDPERSGLWLLPVYVNHSCLPNVQRLIVLDCLFLRAGRDLKAGEELFDSYAETLQPWYRRRDSLASYGFHCCCERCRLEEAVLGQQQKAVEDLLEQAAEAVRGADGAELAERTEAVATGAEVFTAKTLATALQEGRAATLQMSMYELPATPLSAQRMALLRDGFERCVDDAEQRCFEQQDKLQALLLGSLANVLRGFALSLRGLNRYVEAAAAWSRVLDALEQVIPSSELAAIVANDMLSNKLLAFHLDYKKAAQKELRRALLRSHQAYGGGVATWSFLTSKLFAQSVLDGGAETWRAMQKEQSKLASGREQGYCPKDATVAAAEEHKEEKPGFEDLLRKQAVRRTQEKLEVREHKTVERSAPPPSAKVAPTAPRGQMLSTEGEGGAQNPSHPVVAEGVSRVNNANCTVTTETGADGFDFVTVVVHLPGLSSAAEASLEVSETELKVTSLRPDAPHNVHTTLPVKVETSSSTAKWSRRMQQLTIRLRAVQKAERS
ncbi:Rpap3 [Symbiodinium natans]|uniref:Rpap3 protein n=1 Tax=Symbiodinium natans TaxID=878477 RepID=A0A812JDD4_9DINO|nr:Rpap3 [Symbiodinium natans]